MCFKDNSMENEILYTILLLFINFASMSALYLNLEEVRVNLYLFKSVYYKYGIYML